MNTITAHGASYTEVEAIERMVTLIGLNNDLGESDGRVTEINALREAITPTLAAPLVYTHPTRVAAPVRSEARARHDYTVSVHFQTVAGHNRTAEYTTEDRARIGIDRIIAKGGSIIAWA